MKRFFKWVRDFVIWTALFGVAAAYALWYFLPEHRVTVEYVTPRIEKVHGFVRQYWPQKGGEEPPQANNDEELDHPDEFIAPSEKKNVFRPEEEKPVEEKAAKKPAPAKADGPWQGLTLENWYAGRKLTPADLKGKIILVYEFDLDYQDSVDLLPRIQSAWTGFRHKPFLVIGSYRGEKSDRVKKVVAQKKVTFSVYQDAAFSGEPRGVSRYPYLYVVNDRGRLVYHGRSDCDATEAVVNAFGELIMASDGKSGGLGSKDRRSKGAQRLGR